MLHFPYQHIQLEEVNKTSPLLPQFKKLTHVLLLSRNIYSILPNDFRVLSRKYL
jgi:hypothetical protein